LSGCEPLGDSGAEFDSGRVRCANAGHIHQRGAVLADGKKPAVRLDEDDVRPLSLQM
jgi:hypothetical protein